MTTPPLTLADFLLQRITDDEAVARDGFGPTVYGEGVQGDYAALEVAEMGRAEGASELGYSHVLRWMPIRVLAECAAKREVIRIAGSIGGHFEPDAGRLAPQILRALAQPYADHPSFDSRWAL